MNILVTGGAGFIGSHVVDALVELGHAVTVVDDLSTGRRNNINAKANFIELDYCQDELDSVFKNNNFQTVYHFAAQIDVRTSVSDPIADLRVNILGSVRLLELCRKHQVERFIFASTGGAIYGDEEPLPADETHPAEPVSPYGIAKLSVEKYMYFYHREYGFETISLRFGNVYGPRQNPHGEAGVIAIFCNKMLRCEQAYINGDGLQTRDYVYVGDVVRAATRALELKGHNIINIGTSRETDVLTLFNTINRFTGDKCAIKRRPEAPGEQRRSAIDSARANSLLSWKPEVDLERGLELTVEYFRKQIN